ncbi:hypothetical protein U2F26_14995 [Micromonospora sp. 4G57]|uniref:Uncharacterized protein n=1 Tax=Micromonospora sicca TaxID=2202420 RepID=A0ABU5JGX8_9ACTN|nr:MULTISPECIES: hypothetical protein [unclassified Micromonospora]MDZ5444030.1 hypothetical protein [Micromonospora sp. 4G57]MDZ5491843.1 hypothetical protein [Micromonospora sp. 4G53]
MASFAAVALPTCEPNFRPQGVAEEIHGWISSAPMRALVAEYGDTLPAAGVGELLAWLDAFSDRHWDLRKQGRVERDQVKAPSFDSARTELILAAATALRLVNPGRPSHPAYDHLLVLGGLGRACLQRTEYAAHLVRDGVVVVPELAALGSFRPLTKAETTLPALATSRYEVDAMDVGVRMGFGLEDPLLRESSDGPVTHQSWQARTYQAAGCPKVHVLAAPSSEPELRRANTPDTYEFWARRVSLRSTDRVLVVTSPIYVPFQHTDAIRMLAMQYMCGIDTVGFDPGEATIPLAPEATSPDRYLQEIRSGILSMRRLHHALTESVAA